MRPLSTNSNVGLVFEVFLRSVVPPSDATLKGATCVSVPYLQTETPKTTAELSCASHNAQFRRLFSCAFVVHHIAYVELAGVDLVVQFCSNVLHTFLQKFFKNSLGFRAQFGQYLLRLAHL